MAKMKYKISSRATILLGRESVSKVEGALIELIKNTYDADATLCYVFFNIKDDSIYIIDDGTGMTKKIIENSWMMIGTDNKREEYISYKKRIKSGEKGIGRFALDRLGSVCELYTKHKTEKSLIYWKTDWNKFEEAGKELNDIEADFDYLDCSLIDVIPNVVKKEIKNFTNQLNACSKQANFSFLTGTVLKITGLRDQWNENDISRVENSLNFLIPPVEQDDYFICVQKEENKDFELIENTFSDEYDYRILAEFDGDNFNILLNRNEFDLKKIPSGVFKESRFLKFPYRKQDFESKELEFKYSIAEMFNTEDEELIKQIRKIGSFRFNYIFMKLTRNTRDDLFYKEISKNRNVWLKEHGGIKIYRDNFLIRPYGDAQSEAFDWLSLDSRYNSNPVAVTDKSEAWSVRNAQGQGTVFISRVSNSEILDKSSREGIIENDSFKLFKQTIIQIISILERDRAYVTRTFKIYDNSINKKEQTKIEGTKLAKDILSKKNKKGNTKKNINNLAKTVKYYEEEREELISELKLLRSLATNGLITTSIVHDLKSINAILVNRVESFKIAIEQKNNSLIDRNLRDLYKDDMFLKSWITVISNQNKKDKRKRLKKDMYATIERIVDVLEPILTQKKVELQILKDGETVSRRIFESDFESIIYNLIINSIEAFSKAKVDQRKIRIKISYKGDFIIQYNDNGKGITNYNDPYDIFKFGTTSKLDKDGNIIGTGLGMYIVASTIREYNGDYKITETQKGFGLEIRIPI